MEGWEGGRVERKQAVGASAEAALTRIAGGISSTVGPTHAPVVPSGGVHVLPSSSTLAPSLSASSISRRMRLADAWSMTGPTQPFSCPCFSFAAMSTTRAMSAS